MWRQRPLRQRVRKQGAAPQAAARIERTPAEGGPDAASLVGVGARSHLQRTLGNRRLGRLLRGRSDGRPLDAAAQARMEAVLGQDLSGVQVHTGGAASRLAQEHHAEAFATGEEVGFASGRYRPGTPLGDALLAHELAHVAQQRRVPEAAELPGSSAAREREADHLAARAVGVRWPGLRGVAERIASALPARHAPRSAARAGLQLADCIRAEPKLEPPAFLGPHSLEAWNDIKHTIETGRLLENMLVAGPLIVLLTSSPLETAAGGGYPLEQQVNAVRSVDVIVRYKISERIMFLLLQHGNDLTREETLYWERLLDRLQRAERPAEGEVGKE